MATPVIMPRQGQSVESCIITKWHKKKGDPVAVGDLLFSYETDKAAFDEEATVAGELLDVFFEEGDDVECLLTVCVIGEHGEDVSAYKPQTEAAVSESEKPVAQAENPKNLEPQTAPQKPVCADTAQDGRIKISPRAKNWADAHGVDYRFAVGSGPNGRIVEQDVRNLADQGVMVTSAAKSEYLNAANRYEGSGIGGRVSLGDLAAGAAAPVSASVPEAEFTEEPLPNIRKVIARSMHRSLSESAQLTLNTSFDATAVLEYRKMIKANYEQLGYSNITINDIILFAVAKTLPEFRALNAHFYEDKMVYFNHVNLGVAVDTPRGLMVPTIFRADLLSLNELSKQAKQLISDAQNGSVNPDLLTGASFTVTNLGSLGIESFTPVINPPQTGILGVDCTQTKIKTVNGQIVPYQAMGLSLTFDHRALDGAPAAKFLQALKTNLENFTVLLAK